MTVTHQIITYIIGIQCVASRFSWLFLTHWGRETHICVGKLTIIASDNGLSPGRRQTIIWTNAGILLIGSLGTNFNEIFYRNSYIFIQENALENVVREMASMLSRPQYVNELMWRDWCWMHIVAGRNSNILKVIFTHDVFCQIVLYKVWHVQYPMNWLSHINGSIFLYFCCSQSI